MQPGWYSCSLLPHDDTSQLCSISAAWLSSSSLSRWTHTSHFAVIVLQILCLSSILVIYPMLRDYKINSVLCLLTSSLHRKWECVVFVCLWSRLPALDQISDHFNDLMYQLKDRQRQNVMTNTHSFRSALGSSSHLTVKISHSDW